MIEVQNVNFAYHTGEPVITDIDLKINDGDFVALMGHNGSGKTTLSRLFMALVEPRSGKVLVDDESNEGKEPADLADKIGYVFQNPDLQILGDTVFDEVAYGPRTMNLREVMVKKQVESALQATGLSELKDDYPRLLSFGQKRRLGVAAALALAPKTLILDEITNGQDFMEREHMMNYLKKLNDEKGITIILITHDMDVACKFTKRSIVLKEGSLVFDGKTKDLFDGTKPLAFWGIGMPVLTHLANKFGIVASSVKELANGLQLKEEA